MACENTRRVGLSALLLLAPALSAAAGEPPEPSAPSAPTHLEVVSASTGRLDLLWDDTSDNEDGFVVERAPAAGGPAYSRIADLGANVTSYSDEALPSGTAFVYRVLAHNAQGVSDWSNTAPGRTAANWLAIIAVNRYEHLRPLQAPTNDARELKRVLLSRYRFDEAHTIELLDDDATLNGIHKLLGRLNREVKSQDSLVLYYAGHGILDSVTNTGYWIPYDGGTGFGENWLGDVAVQGFLLNVSAKHVLIIADSCYSGNLLAGSRAIETERAGAERYRREHQLRSRTVLTSGNQEPVTDAAYGDHSAFAWHLVRTLEENRQPYVDVEDLYYHVRRGVEGQQPLLGPLKNVGHETGGAYVFVVKDAKPLEALVELPSEPPSPLTSSPAEPRAAREDPTPEIRKLLERWRTAYEALDLAGLREIWPACPFGGWPSTVKGFKIGIPEDSVEIRVSGTQAVLTCTVHIEAFGRSRDTHEYRARFLLEQQPGGWKILEHRSL